MSDPWWPVGYRLPAFEVQRRPYGDEHGGDYVRGTATLPHTALRYPTQSPDFDEATNKAFLTVRPLPLEMSHMIFPPKDGRPEHTVSYETGVTEVHWGWPIGYGEDWTEVSLVRSAFGAPSTVNDGQTVFRAARFDYSTPSTPAVLNPTVSLATAGSTNYNIRANYEFQAYVTVGASVNPQYLCAHWTAATGGRDWIVYLNTAGGLQFQYSLDGTTNGWATPLELATAAQIAALPRDKAGLVYLGVRFNLKDGPATVSAITSTTGSTWTTFGTTRTASATAIADTFNAATRISVGARSDNSISTLWQGKIAWVQAVIQPSTIVWRFDADEYPFNTGNTTTWTDQRNVNWLVNTAEALERVVVSAMTVPPPLVYDRPLQPGRFYYYTLFFKTSPYEWIRGMSGQVLIPRNFHHADHLWNTLPPFYRLTDSNYREGNGPLHNFLNLFGFELDLTREYAEQWQETYHVDRSPLTLLRRVGENFGVPYRSAVGDVRYRSLMAALPLLLQTRGTVQALHNVIEAGTKWQCEVTQGENLMLLTDDADFLEGTGNWATQWPNLGTLWNELTPDEIQLSNDGLPPQTNYGRKSMRVITTKATETEDFALTCGAGWINDLPGDETRWIAPVTSGVAVEPGYQYGFAIRVNPQVNVTITTAILWFRGGGRSVDYILKQETPPQLTTAGTWVERSIQSIAPTEATYMVPALFFTNRAASANTTWSTFIDLAGSVVWLVDQVSAVREFIPPDKYLTLGDPDELLGIAIEGQQATTGYLLGKSRSTLT